MCVPSLNDICESICELSRTQVKMYGGGTTDVKPIYHRLLSGDIIIIFLIFIDTKHFTFDKFVTNVGVRE